MKKINKSNKPINVDSSAKAFPETRINTILDMSQQVITNVADAFDPLDGLNLLQAKGIIGISIQIKTSLKNDFSNFIPLIGTTIANPITGDLLFNNNSTVTGLKAATNPQDAINFLQSKQFFSNKYISLSGTATSGPVTGDLYLDNTVVTGIRNAVEDSEAISLQQLQETEQSLILLSGGTLTGPINMDSHKIINVPEASSSTDLVPLGQAKEKITALFEECVPLTGTLPDKPITGTIFLNNTLISQLPLATEPYQIISLDNLNAVSETFVLLNNPTLSGNLDLSGHLITDVAPATTDSEGVNLQQFTAETHSLLPLSGGTMSVNLDMGDNTISSLGNNSLQNDDLINLATLTQYVSQSNPDYIPLSGTVNNRPVSGSLVFDSEHLITGISNPSINEDAVNLETLTETMALKVLLTGGTLTGPLNMNNHSISNLSVSDSPKDSDAATPGYLKNLFTSQKYISLSGTLADAPITGQLFFNNDATCTQIKNPENDLDAVNLQTLQTTADRYLSLSGGTMTGELDMNNHQILNVPTPGDNPDLVSFSYLKTATSRLVPLSSPAPITMEGGINMNSHTFTNVPTATLPSELVNFIQVKNTLSDLSKDFILFSGTPAESSITGNLALNNVSVKNISPPAQPKDAITLLSLQTKFKDCLLLTGGTLTGSLNANNQIISGVQTTNKRTNAATLDNLNTLLGTLYPLSGGTLSGTLNMNGNTITTLAEPTQSSDAINLSYLTKTTTATLSRFIPFSGTLQDVPITEDLVLNNTFITNISVPKNDEDAIQLQTLYDKKVLYLPLAGGTLLGTLNMNGHTLTHLKTPSTDSELINLAYLNSISTELDGKYIPLTGTVSGSSVSGDLVLNGTSITNISVPKNDGDAIQRKTLDDKKVLYLPLVGETLSGTLNMNNHTINNIKVSNETSSLINLQTCTTTLSNTSELYVNLNENSSTMTGNISLSSTGKISGLTTPENNNDIINLGYLTSTFNNYMPLSGGILTNTLDMNNNSITNINSNPKNPNDSINLDALNNHMSKIGSDVIPLSGTTSINPITGNLILNNTKIVNIIDPKEASDITNLYTLHTKFSNYLLVTGGSITNTLDMNSFEITGISEGTNPTDAITYQQMTTSPNINNYIQLNNINNITGTMTLNNTYIKNIPNPKNNSDAINLEYLRQSYTNCLSLSGGTLTGALNMNTHTITNLGNGINPKEAANYGQLSSEFYIKCPGGALGSSPFSWTSTFDFTFDTSSLLSSDFSKSYFNVSSTKLFILQAGVYIFQLNCVINASTQSLAHIGAFLTSPLLGNSVNITKCTNKYPQNICLSLLLPLDKSNISDNNTYLEIMNLGDPVSISSSSWNIFSVNSVDI